LIELMAIYQRPSTSKAATAPKVYPYRLGRLAIERINQVWCSDVTYILMDRGLLYLVFIIDWVSRAALAWRLSNMLGADLYRGDRESALAVPPREISNADQGSQFTSDDFTGNVKRYGITISMDRKDRRMDDRRTATAKPEIRGGLPQGLCDARRDQGRHWRGTPASKLRLPHAAANLPRYVDERPCQAAPHPPLPKQLGRRGNARLRPHTTGTSQQRI
jgi:transposase InsO family protein